MWSPAQPAPSTPGHPRRRALRPGHPAQLRRGGLGGGRPRPPRQRRRPFDGGHVWHLPAHPPLTGFELCALVGRATGLTITPRPVPAAALRLLGVLRPEARAVAAMSYQQRRDHLFDDSRFRRRFPDLEEPPLDRLLAATAASFA